jgi:low temperature requirement protein LtrA
MAGLGRVALIFGNLCWIHGGYARCRVPHPGAHFVERHGLIVLIALGESIVTVGVGMAGRGLRADRVVTAVLGLDLAAALWWRYFDGEDEQAERVLDAAGVDHTTWLTLYRFGYAFLPVLGGIIMFAAGIKNAVGHQAERLAEGVRVAGGLSVSGCG